MRLHNLSSALTLPDFSRRSCENERLDQEGLNPKELRHILHDLARFNGAMLGRSPVLRWLREPLSKASERQPIRLLDVGCGYGDLLREIRRWTTRRGIPVTLRGIDVNPHTINIARAATDPCDAIAFETADVLRLRSADQVDLVVSSLFSHHLADEKLVEFLIWMETTAVRGWLICDLQRHPLPYYVIALAGRVAPLHPVVFSDGQLSVRRSLTRKEWKDRLNAARIPLEQVTIRSFLFRYAIGRLR
jgi:SAM-dependent methyltransferase